MPRPTNDIVQATISVHDKLAFVFFHKTFSIKIQFVELLNLELVNRNSAEITVSA